MSNSTVDAKDETDIKRVLIDEDTHALLKRIAKSDDRTIQATARLLVREAAVKRGIDPDEPLRN